VLGGTLLLGGRISVVGAILGACFLEMIDNALILLGVNPYWYQVFLGLIILGALVLERGRISVVSRRMSS
jgi:ribose/xylose/arabinose/galactoside ABC-type transport system permease subunit